MARIEAVITAKDNNASSVFAVFGETVIALNQGLELTKKAISALTAPFGAIISEGKAFEAQMSAVKAISKTTTEDFKALTDEAQRIGETTAFTATQAGSAMESLRRAGMNTAQVLATTSQAMDLASATGAELATAADTVAVQLNIFKDTGIEANKIVDLMVQTVGASPQSFADLNSALANVSGTASAFGMSFEDLTATLGVMAEAGVTASVAGTALNAAFSRLAKPSAEASTMLSKYGITLSDINPAQNSFADILDRLNSAGMDQADIITLLGQEAAPKFFKVIEGGGEALREFAEKQEQANTASEAARERLDNLEGSLALYGSALSGLKLEIFDTMNSVIRRVVDSSTALVNIFTTFVKNNSGAIESAFEMIWNAAKQVREMFFTVIRAIGTLIVGFADLLETSAVTTLFTTITDAARTFIGAITDIVVAIVSAVKNSDTMQTAFGLLKEIFFQVVTAASEVIRIVSGVGRAFADFLIPYIQPVIDLFGQFLTVALTFVRDGWNVIIDRLKAIENPADLVTTAIDGIKTALEFLGDLSDKVSGRISSFVGALSTAVTNSEPLQTAFETMKTILGLLKPLFSALITVGGELARIIGDIAESFKSDLNPGLQSVVDLLGNVLSAVTELLENGVRLLIGGLELLAKGLSNIQKPGETIKAVIDSVRDTIEKFIETVDSVKTKIQDLAGGTFGKLLGAFGKVESASDTVGGAVSKLTGIFKDQEDQLWTHSTIPALHALAKTARPIGEAMQKIGTDTAEATEEFKKIEVQANGTQKALEKVAKIGTGLDLSGLWKTIIGIPSKLSSTFSGINWGEMFSGAGSWIAGIPGRLSDAFKNIGKIKIQDILEIGKGAIKLVAPALISAVGSMVKSLAGFVISGIKGTEEYKKGTESISGAINKIFAPFGKAIQPLMQAVAEGITSLAPIITNVVDRLMPLVQPLVDIIGQLFDALGPILEIIVDFLMPILEMIVTDIMPVIIEILKALTPILKSIFEILGPIIQAIIPIITAILEIIVELLPLIEALVNLIKPFVPIIVALAGVIARVVDALKPIIEFLVNVLVPIIEALTAVIEIVADVIFFLVDIIEALPKFLEEALKAGLATALAPLVIAFAALQFLFENVLKPIFEGLSTALSNLQGAFQPLIDVLKKVADAVGGGLGGAAKGAGGVVSGIVGGAKKLLGFAGGTGTLSRDQLMRLPGMGPDEGLIKAHAGEAVITKNENNGGMVGANITINVTALDPRAQVEEIRQVLEELYLSGRLRVA
jgi:TP901 family phage tail tape measure protein